MEPVLKRGLAEWDQALLPRDEFEARVRVVRAELERQGLEALAIVNYSVLGNLGDYSSFAYLAGMQSGGALVVSLEGDPTMISFGGGREMAFIRTQTWIEDIRVGGANAFAVMRDVLGERGIKVGKIGTVGVDGMPAARIQDFDKAFNGCDLKAFDSSFSQIKLSKRPREILAIGAALNIARNAAAAGLETFTKGGSNLDAMLAAEEAARVGRARDVRILANTGGDQLRPFENSPHDRHSSLLLWVAVQYQGYWAEAVVTSPEAKGNPADAALDAMKGKASAGAKISEIAKAALAKLRPDARETALSYGLGNMIGLSLDEGVEIHPDSDQVLVDGTVLSLRVFAKDAEVADFQTSLLEVTADGVKPVQPVALSGA